MCRNLSQKNIQTKKLNDLRTLITFVQQYTQPFVNNLLRIALLCPPKKCFALNKCFIEKSKKVGMVKSVVNYFYDQMYC